MTRQAVYDKLKHMELQIPFSCIIGPSNCFPASKLDQALSWYFGRRHLGDATFAARGFCLDPSPRSLFRGSAARRDAFLELPVSSRGLGHAEGGTSTNRRFVWSPTETGETFCVCDLTIALDKPTQDGILVAHSDQPAAKGGRRGVSGRSLLRPLEPPKPASNYDRRSAVRDRYFGLSEGGVVRILHGMCGVQRGVCGESGDSRGTRQEVRRRGIVDLLSHLGSRPSDCRNDDRHPDRDPEVFRTMSSKTFAATLVELVHCLYPAEGHQAQAWAQVEATQNNQWENKPSCVERDFTCHA